MSVTKGEARRWRAAVASGSGEARRWRAAVAHHEPDLRELLSQHAHVDCEGRLEEQDGQEDEEHQMRVHVAHLDEIRHEVARVGPHLVGREVAIADGVVDKARPKR